MYVFFVFSSKLFMGLQMVKQQIWKTSKIGNNLIFIAKFFLKMEEKTYLKGSQNGLVWPE